jgi:adenylosuccinate lyase
MLARHEHPDISAIWSSAFEEKQMRAIWLRHRAFYGPDKRRPPQREIYPKDEHEIVDHLTQACLDFQDGDLHWGLTSSDVVDFVRISQVEMSIAAVEKKLREIAWYFNDKTIEWKVEATGYTHLLPAVPVNFGKRFSPAVDQLYELLSKKPEVIYKDFGGPVGREEFKTLKKLNIRLQKHSNQTSDGFTYFETASWLANIARVIHKSAYDLRVLYSMGELALCSKVGSSSMTHKVNPTLFERVCSLAVRQPSFVTEIWHATAHSALERTLTDSALLRNVLPEMFHNIMRQLDDFHNGLKQIKLNRKHIRKKLSENKKNLKTYRDLIKKSAIKPRLDVYFEQRGK